MLKSNLRAVPHSNHVICSLYGADNGKQVSYLKRRICLIFYVKFTVMDKKNCKPNSIHVMIVLAFLCL